MEIILSKQCESLTGSLGRGFGYHIQRRKNGYFAKRNSKGVVPPEGHWRFILTCAELAQNKLHIADIRVSGVELKEALYEDSFIVCSMCVDLDHVYNANDVLTFKKIRGL